MERFLACLLLVLVPARHRLRRGEMGKKGCRRVPIRQCLNKTEPLKYRVVPSITLTLFLPVHADKSEVTRFIPPQSTSQGLPKLRIKKCFFCQHEALLHESSSR